jgi:hypothetical protein
MQTSSRLRSMLGLAVLGATLVACSDDSSGGTGQGGAGGSEGGGAAGAAQAGAGGASAGTGQGGTTSPGAGGTTTQGTGGTAGASTQGQGGTAGQGTGGAGGTAGQGTQGGGNDPQGEGGQGTQGGGSDPQGEGGQGTQGGGNDPQGGTGGAGGATSSDDRQYCVDKINEYRATLSLPPLARWADAEVCSDGEAKADSETGQAHSAFGKCGESAQNECPGWPGPVQSLLDGCLQVMWDEGPGEDFSKHGHYINMSSTSYTQVACGFFQTSQGGYWAVQNFR